MDDENEKAKELTRSINFRSVVSRFYRLMGLSVSSLYSSYPGRTLLAALVLYRICVCGCLFFALYFWGEIDFENASQALQHWPRTGELEFSSHFATWDTAHYLYLSEVGYKSGSPSCAFYPFWPFVVFVVGWFLDVGHLFAGTLLSNLFSALGLLMLYNLVRSRCGPTVALWTVVLLNFFPGSLFLLLHYSESLFFFLSMCYFLAVERKLATVQAISLFLLPLTRPVGVFFVVPLFVRFALSESKRADFFLMLVPVLGWGAYFVAMGVMTGNPLEGFDAQRFWPLNSVGNLFSPRLVVSRLFDAVAFHSYYGSAVDRVFWLLAFWSLPLVFRIDREWFFYGFMLAVLPGVLSLFVSYTRYLLLAFPVFVAFAILILRVQESWGRIVVLVSLALLKYWLLWRHVNFVWAG